MLCAHRKLQKRYAEPDWYLPTQAIKAADLLGVTNLQNIATNLGLDTLDYRRP